MKRRSIAIAVLVLASLSAAVAQTQQNAGRPSTSPAAATPPAATTTTAPAKPAVKKDTRKETPAEWFERVVGINVRAYANLTAVRAEREVDRAPRLVTFDRTTGKEETLWECGGCWSPFPAGSDLYVLRQTTDDAARAELWVVHRDAKAERVAAVPSAVAISAMHDGDVIVGRPAERCADSTEGPNGFVIVDVSEGKLREIEDAPCVGNLGLASAARVRGDRYLDTTHRADLQGNRRDRAIQVLSPATGDTPSATYFDARLGTRVDRYDPVWLTDERIAYVAKP